MVSFPKRRLQVFVSSTYNDLIPERQVAVQAILKAGHIPAGMELFAAGNQSQMEVIKQWIDQSDVFLLILGVRYGSIDPESGKSYIQVEYEYALEREKEIFACVISDKTAELKIKELDKNTIKNEDFESRDEFCKLVKGKMISEWEDEKDIKSAILESLLEIDRRNDLVGWVRADQQTDISVLEEVARLSKENATLRHQIEQGAASKTINGLTFDEFIEALAYSNILDTFLSIFDDRLNHGTMKVKVEGDKNKEWQLNKLVKLGVIEIVGSNNMSDGRPWSLTITCTDSGKLLLSHLTAKAILSGKSEFFNQNPFK